MQFECPVGNSETFSRLPDQGERHGTGDGGLAIRHRIVERGKEVEQLHAEPWVPTEGGERRPVGEQCSDAIWLVESGAQFLDHDCGGFVVGKTPEQPRQQLAADGQDRAFIGDHRQRRPQDGDRLLESARFVQGLTEHDSKRCARSLIERRSCQPRRQKIVVRIPGKTCTPFQGTRITRDPGIKTEHGNPEHVVRIGTGCLERVCELDAN